MASGKKTSKYTRRYNSRKSSTRRKNAEPLDSSLQDEIVMILILAVCVLLFLCNFGIIGKVGDVLSDIEFGLFGLLAYIAPILFFLATAFQTINRGSKAATRKLIAGGVLFILFGMIFEFLAGRIFEMSKINILSFYTDAAKQHTGGGIIAGTLAFFLLKYLSLVGSILLIIVIGLICIVLVTEKSFLEGAKEGGRYAGEAMENVVRRHEERENRRREEYEARLVEIDAKRESREEKRKVVAEEREEKRREKQRLAEERENERILRMDKKSRGVMMNISLDQDTLNKTPINIQADEIDFEAEKARDNIHEITFQCEVEDEVSAIDYGKLKEADTLENNIEFSRPAKQDSHTTYSVKKKETVIETSDAYATMPEPVTEFHPRTIENEEVPHTEELLHTTSEKDEEQKKIINKDATTHTNTGGKSVEKYAFPPSALLQKGNPNAKGNNAQELKEIAYNLQNTLNTFGVSVRVTDISQGPAVTRYELQPEQGVKVSKIVNLADDIKLNLAATDIRIEAPIPGKAAVGIEVPNKDIMMVSFRDLIEAAEYQKSSAKLTFAVGKDIGGRVVVTDIAKMPHLLIAGATGSGKSVCINTIIMSVLYKARPDEVKLIMIDPKVVELSVYNGVPHLLLPVVTDPKKAAASLQWGVKEMTDRYQKFAEQNVRDLKGYNKKVADMRKTGNADAPSAMPQILIIVDELADLMMVAPGEVEEAICRLAQLARAAGIHLIIATQRPSVDVITGLIKANMPSRIAFAVSSGVDSRTILDSNGAEKLLGKGDMLFYPQGYPKPLRIQGAFVSDNEVQDVVNFLKNQNIICDYNPDIQEQIKASAGLQSSGSVAGNASKVDELFRDAGDFVIDKDKASIGMLQRVFKIGFNRAARIMDQLCEAGVVGEEDGTKPRKVLMSHEQFENYIEETL